MYNLLRRSKQTPYLTHYAADARQATMKKVFTPRDKTAIRGKHILLVDDVLTTGSTLKEAARELWGGEPATVTAAVVARVAQ